MERTDPADFTELSLTSGLVVGVTHYALVSPRKLVQLDDGGVRGLTFWTEEEVECFVSECML